MNKFVFTYLVKQDEKTWFDLTNSLYLLNKLILLKLKCSYKVLIFCEGPPSEKAGKLINFLLKKNINIKLKEISLKKYVKRDSSKDYISDFPHSSDCTKNFSLGYRDMCKFFAIDIFNDIELSDSEYYVRLDTDSFFLDVKDKFIKNIQNIKEDYGYINTSIQKEDKSVSLGFGNCLYEFCRGSESIKKISKNYLEICQEASKKPKIFYTNFEIIKLEWIKSDIYFKLLEHIVNSEGIYRFRWGDALIRYYSIKLIGADILPLKGCLYKHNKVFDSRIFHKRISSIIYSKIKHKLKNDSFEIRPSWIDRFFLSIKG